MKIRGSFVFTLALAIACTISTDTLAQSPEDHQRKIEDVRKRSDEIRQRLEEQQESERLETKRRNEEEARIQSERLFPKKDDLSGFDSLPTRKVYGIDNRGDRELYPDLIIEPSIYDRYEVYETDRDGLKKWEPKAIIKQGLHDRYEVYKTDRD